MTIEEYKENCTAVRSESEKKLKDLAVKYAMSNNTIGIGDTFTDHIGSIKVEKIGTVIGRFDDKPYCQYYGIVLKKDLTPTKKLEKRYAYQINQHKDIKNDR